MKTIVITPNGKNKQDILVDEQYKWLAKYSWSVGAGGYALAWIDGKARNLHSYILPPPKGMYVDHINGVRTDNRMSNLRIVTPSQNRMNAVNHRGISDYKGVTFCKQTQRWACRVGSTWGGRFNSELDAALKYNEIAAEKYGEYARLNEVVR